MNKSVKNWFWLLNYIKIAGNNQFVRIMRACFGGTPLASVACTKIFLLSFFIFSCEQSTVPINEQPTPTGKYQNGVFLVNEGNFGWGYGEVSFIHQNETVENEIFRGNNKGNILGNVAQSMNIIEKEAFIVLNNSQKIEILIAETMQSVGVIQGFVSPRYICPIHAERAFVTDLYANAFWEINPKKREIVKKIAFDGWSEAILKVGNRLWVSNMTKAQVQIYELSNLALTRTISLFGEPNSMVLDKNGKIWVLCSGKIDGKEAKLFRINPDDFTLEKSWTIPQRASNLQLDAVSENLYFLAHDLFKMNIADEYVSSLPFVKANERLFYGYKVLKNGDILLADAIDYVQAGKVYHLEANTLREKKVYKVGVIPSFFCETAH